MNRDRKKAQMEMIGLVVIVILITLGILLLAVFALKESPEKKIFTRKELAYSAMSALMNTDVECFRDGKTKYLKLGKDILVECAEDYETLPVSSRECGSQNVCEFFQTKVQELLDLTLGNWNKDYQFQAKFLLGGEELFEPILGGGGCENRERDTSSQPLPSRVGQIKSSLFICD